MIPMGLWPILSCLTRLGIEDFVFIFLSQISCLINLVFAVVLLLPGLHLLGGLPLFEIIIIKSRSGQRHISLCNSMYHRSLSSLEVSLIPIQRMTCLHDVPRKDTPSSEVEGRSSQYSASGMHRAL